MDPWFTYAGALPLEFRFMPLALTFLGAAKNVTGSRHLVEADGTRVLIDCGLFQERENAARNWEPFAVPPSSLDAVLLTHAHIDHVGWLPRLVRQGFRGPTHCSQATAEIVPVVLSDSARLQAEDVAHKRKRHAAEGRQSPRPLAPMYDERDVEQTCRALRGVPFGISRLVAPGFRATFLPAGHILGASVILLEHEPSGSRVVFSGDLGREARPLVPDPASPPAADLIVVESTYGDRVHDDSVDVKTQLAEVLNATFARGGSVLIPGFAVERAQELLYYLQELRDAGRIPSVPVFLDSPMAVRMLSVFERNPEALDSAAQGRVARSGTPFDLPELVLCSSSAESKRINHHREPSVIIAGSGMCTGGRIKHHLSLRLDDERSTLLFVGYQASGTLGRQLVEGKREVRLFGARRQVGLEVQQIHGFSGHGDQNELLAWLGKHPGGPRRVAVVHGGPRVAGRFADRVADRFGCGVEVPEYGARIEL